MINLLDLAPADAERALRAFLEAEGEPGYRAGQVVARLWARPVATFDEMTDLPVRLRTRLAEAFKFRRRLIEAGDMRGVTFLTWP